MGLHRYPDPRGAKLFFPLQFRTPVRTHLHTANQSPTAVQDPSTNSFAYSQSETARTHLHTANPPRVIQP